MMLGVGVTISYSWHVSEEVTFGQKLGMKLGRKACEESQGELRFTVWLEHVKFLIDR